MLRPGEKPFVVGRSSSFGLTPPPAAGRSSQAASDSDAASRQQIQSNDIASSDPRLAKK